jgi:hypothetical protein
MKHLLAQKRGLVLLLCLMLSFSCGGKVTSRSNPTKFKFTINGVVIKDMELGKDIAYFAILRDGNPFGGAVVKVGNDTLVNQGNGNYYLEGFPLFSFGQTVSINVSSPGDDFNLSHSVKMPGSFQITAFNPPVVTSDKTHVVYMYGSASAGADGYFTNVIRPDGTNGYAELVSLSEMIEGAHILRETFEPGEVYTPGTYTVYAVAYKGGFVSYPGIPFSLPNGLPKDSISGANGTIGAGVIAPLASLTAE